VVALIYWNFIGGWKPCLHCSTLVLGGSTDLLELYWRLETLSPLVMVVFTLSRRATWPFPPWTHLNFSSMIIQRLYLCSTLVLGGSTDLLELYWLVKTLCLGRSWWFSPCQVMLLGHSLHGPTTITLFRLYKGYICVPHWCWVVALISGIFIGRSKPCCMGRSR
jgi:hypothetical protein